MSATCGTCHCARREQLLFEIKKAAEDLLETIELHTDCMDGHIRRESLDEWMENLESACKSVEASEVPA